MAKRSFYRKYRYILGYSKRPLVISRKSTTRKPSRKRPLRDPWYIPPIKKLIGPAAFSYSAVAVVPTLISHFARKGIHQVPQYGSPAYFDQQVDFINYIQGHAEL